MLHNEDRKEEHKQFLSWLLKIIKTECIDALVVSGDIFDVYAPSTTAQKLYYDFLAGIIKLENAPDVFIIAGNHDSRLFLGAPSDILSKLKIHVISAVDIEKPGNCIFEIKNKNDEAAIVICAIPFLREKDLKIVNQSKSCGADSLLEQYNKNAAAFYHDVYKIAKTKNAPVLMTGHFYLDGGMKSDDYSERAREVGCLQSLPAGTLPDADYYALGHLHKGQVVNGKNHIRYSGSPLPMSFSEAENEKSVVIAIFGENPAETKPVIQLKNIPVWQNLRQIKGSPDKILNELDRVKESGENVWLEIQVTDYAGDLFNFWNTLEKEPPRESLLEIPVEPSYRILVKQDMRVHQNSGDWRGSDESVSLSAMEPAAVFEKFLRDEKVNAENIDIFMKMFSELYYDVIVNENGGMEVMEV
jgi:exonuclease SbcD